MKLLVTGGAGYVGSVCAAVLVEQGHDVTIIDNFSTGNREAVPETARVVEGDVVGVGRGVVPMPPIAVRWPRRQARSWRNWPTW